MKRLKPIDPPPISRDTPLRLDIAAAYAFPDGTVSERSLRREIRAGRLHAETIGGADYTTLAHIEEMRKLCRKAAAREPASTSAQPEEPDERPGSSETVLSSPARDALLMNARRLSKGLLPTSPPSTSRRAPARRKPRAETGASASSRSPKPEAPECAAPAIAVTASSDGTVILKPSTAPSPRRPLPPAVRARIMDLIKAVARQAAREDHERELAERAARVASSGALPVAIGGDHHPVPIRKKE